MRESAKFQECARRNSNNTKQEQGTLERCSNAYDLYATTHNCFPALPCFDGRVKNEAKRWRSQALKQSLHGCVVNKNVFCRILYVNMTLKFVFVNIFFCVMQPILSGPAASLFAILHSGSTVGLE